MHHTLNSRKQLHFAARSGTVYDFRCSMFLVYSALKPMGLVWLGMHELQSLSCDVCLLRHSINLPIYSCLFISHMSARVNFSFLVSSVCWPGLICSGLVLSVFLVYIAWCVSVSACRSFIFVYFFLLVLAGFAKQASQLDFHCDIQLAIMLGLTGGR